MTDLDALEARLRTMLSVDSLDMDGIKPSNTCTKAADAIQSLRAELAEAKDSVKFYMDESDAHCKAQQELRSANEQLQAEVDRLTNAEGVGAAATLIKAFMSKPGVTPKSLKEWLDRYDTNC